MNGKSADAAVGAPLERAAWRGIAALNGSSALAQIGQYGIAFVLFPLALEAHGVAAWQIGIVSSAVWLGMLLGLLGAPAVVARCAHRNTVLIGLALSTAALLATPWLPPAAWAPTAALTGFGLGLRWIGLETWLYNVVPNESRGRIVGFHETLLGTAAVGGPALIAVLGATADASFIAAAAFVALAALPLAWTGAVRLPAPSRAPRRPAAERRAAWHRFFGLGPLIAGLGGMIEGALLGMFPVYAAAQGYESSQAAGLLTVFGIGAMLLQFPLGWLVDGWGLRKAALLTAGVTVAAALLIGLGRWNGPWLAAPMFVLGGSITGFLTLGLIAAALKPDAAQVTGDVSRVSVAYTGLSVPGPLAAGALASLAGPASLMGFIAAAAATVVAIVLSIREQRPA